jgi:hypothetical protein
MEEFDLGRRRVEVGGTDDLAHLVELPGCELLGDAITREAVYLQETASLSGLGKGRFAERNVSVVLDAVRTADLDGEAVANSLVACLGNWSVGRSLDAGDCLVAAAAAAVVVEGDRCMLCTADGDQPVVRGTDQPLQ